MKVVSITHSDLDGVVCAILIKEYCRQKGHELEIFKAHYNDIDTIFKDNYDKNKFIIISDISLQKEPEWATKVNNILYIDHHSTVKSNLKNKYVNYTKAGCQLVFEYFSQRGVKFSPEFEKLTKLANDYDLWQNKYKLSTMVNYLYFLYKFESFLTRFTKGFNELSKEELFYLQQKQREIRNVLTNIKYDAINEHVAFVTTGDYINEISKELYTNRGFMYVFIYNPDLKSLSLRGNNDCVIHCGEFLEMFGGGGHRGSGGLYIGDNIKKISEVLKGFEVAYDTYHPIF